MRMDRKSVLPWLFFILFVTTRAYYLPGTFPQAWSPKEILTAEVNALASYDTELPYDFYSLPICKPPGGAEPAKKNVNIGTFLMGQRLETSPYNFTMMVDEVAKEACPEEGFYGPLTADEAKLLQDRIEEHYRININLDNLPVTTYDLEEEPESVRTGFDIGFTDGVGSFYVNNHIEFKVLVHPVTAQFLSARETFYAAEMDVRRRLLLSAEAGAGGGDGDAGEAGPTPGADPGAASGSSGMQGVYYTVVGFEAKACSLKREAGWATYSMRCPGSGGEDGAMTAEPQPVKEGEKIVYTYDVSWEVSDIKWVSRWDAYLRMPRGTVHWFSILNSVLVVLVLSGVVAVIMLRTIRRDLAKYEELILNETENGVRSPEAEAGWKALKSDVFRAPPKCRQLSMLVGCGLQIFLASSLTLLFGAFGFLSPAVRGALLSTLLGLYMLLSTVAGFTSVYLYSSMTRSTHGWRALSLESTGAVPGLLVAVLVLMNLLIMHTGSSGAIPLSALIPIGITWLLVCFPLGYLGGVMASRTPLVEYPTKTSQIPREVPYEGAARWRTLSMFFASGLLTFGNVFVELYFAMTSMWQGYFYYLMGFVLVIGLLTVVITAQISVVTVYVQFCRHDYRWWWQSFHRGGAVAVFIALYAVGFLVWSLNNLSGFTSIAVYLVYMSLLVGAVYISLGSIGFVVAFWFTRSIFASAKSD